MDSRRQRQPVPSVSVSEQEEMSSGWATLDRFPRRFPISWIDSISTAAEGHTSAGERVRVALNALPPPRVSALYIDGSHASGAAFDARYLRAVAAHRSCILLHLAFPAAVGWRKVRHDEDYLLYQPARRTLVTLPTCSHSGFVAHGKTGVLCSEDGGDFAVAHLALGDEPHEDLVAAPLCILKKQQGQGSYSWVHETLRVRHASLPQLHLWDTDHVVPCGDFLCWVDLLRGIILCNVLSPDPVLRYVPLPIDPHDDKSDFGVFRGAMGADRNVCATADGTLKFVDVAHKGSSYPTSSDKIEACTCKTPFVICSWVLSPYDAHKSWTLEFIMNAHDFWALTDAFGLPRVPPEFPLVDVKHPHIAQLVLREHLSERPGQPNTFIVGLDMLNKTVHSTLQVQCEVYLTYPSPQLDDADPWGRDLTTQSSPVDAYACSESAGTASYNLTCNDPFIAFEV